MYEKDNYKILSCNKKSKYCLVCFSSNGLKLENENRYEFQNITNNRKIRKFYNKIIFVRDVKKHFYIEGINSDINNLEKTIFFLQEKTEGLIVRTIGNSSGGFMAFLTSCNLKNVELCYSFSGVLAPLEWHGPNFDYNVYDYECLKNADKKTFVFLNSYKIAQPITFTLLHFASFYNRADSLQTEIIKKHFKNNLIMILMKTTTHGSTIWSYDFKYLLTKKLSQLASLSKLKQPVSKSRFSFHNQGLFSYLINLFSFGIRKLLKVKRKTN